MRGGIPFNANQAVLHRLVILEEDKSNAPESEPKAAAVFEPVEAGNDPSFDLNKLIDPFSYEIWWDIEDECYAYDDLCLSPPPRHDGLPSILILTCGRPHSHLPLPRPLHDLTNQHDRHKTIRGASDETLPHPLTSPLDKDGGGGLLMERDLYCSPAPDSSGDRDTVLYETLRSSICRSGSIAVLYQRRDDQEFNLFNLLFYLGFSIASKVIIT
jgi:hypothetical protein